MIEEHGDPDRTPLVLPSSHIQTNDELTADEAKQVKADDQAIQTILISLPEDIYAVIDNLFTPDQPSNITYMQHPQPNNYYVQQPPFHMNYMQQPMNDPKDISDPTTAMNMALVLMAKAFKLNYTTPIKNNQIISSNPRNREIAQPSMNMGQERHMQMARGTGQNAWNQIGQNIGENLGFQNVGNHNRLIVVLAIGNQNENVVDARAENNGNENNADKIRCYICRGVFEWTVWIELKWEQGE
nr:hypothetical protein [Tanacetum cinerariifolium]